MCRDARLMNAAGDIDDKKKKVLPILLFCWLSVLSPLLRLSLLHTKKATSLKLWSRPSPKKSKWKHASGCFFVDDFFFPRLGSNATTLFSWRWTRSHLALCGHRRDIFSHGNFLNTLTKRAKRQETTCLIDVIQTFVAEAWFVRKTEQYRPSYTSDWLTCSLPPPWCLYIIFQARQLPKRVFVSVLLLMLQTSSDATKSHHVHLMSWHCFTVTTNVQETSKNENCPYVSCITWYVPVRASAWRFNRQMFLCWKFADCCLLFQIRQRRSPLFKNKFDHCFCHAVFLLTSVTLSIVSSEHSWPIHFWLGVDCIHRRLMACTLLTWCSESLFAPILPSSSFDSDVSARCFIKRFRSTS